MKKLYYLFVAILFATGIFAQDTVSVNSAIKYQTIKAWGGTGGQNTQFENTPPYMIKLIINESVNDLGLTGLRYEGYQGSYSQSYGMCRSWEWTNDNESPDTSIESAFDTTAIDYYMKNLFVPWKQATVAAGDSFTFYFSPSWYYQGSTGDIPAFLGYSPGEYAEYYITNMKYLKRKYGLVPDYMTMCNEAGNANRFTTGMVDTMIHTLGTWIQKAGFHTTIQFPECVSPQISWNYINALAGDTAVWSKVKCLSYHLYGTNDPYRAKIDSFAKLKGIYTGQTEEIGQGINILFQDLTLGGVSYWDFYGNGDYMVQNANDTWFSYGAKYWTTREIIHYNHPGSVRIGCTSNDTAKLQVIAFQNGANITTTILNDKASSVTENVTISGLPAGPYAATQSLTSGTFSGGVGLFTVTGAGTLTVPVAANSVVTVYPHPANLPPIAVSWAANPTYIESPATSVALSANGLDPEGTTVKYHWRVDSFPVGASVVLSNANISNPTATGMTVAGDYVFSVNMNDGVDSIVKQLTVMAFSGNQPPQIVELQSRIPTIITLPVDTTVIRGFCQDMEADPLTYQYSIVSQPVGAAAVLVTPTASNTVIRNMTKPGDYTVQYSVTDGKHAAVTRNILLTVYPVNHAPVIDSIGATPAVMNLPASTTTLSSVTSDPDTDIVSHWWTVKSAPVGANPVFAMQGERVTGVSGLTVAGTYVFTLTAVDRTLVARKNVTVVVNAATGVNSITNQNSGVELYPNPANDQITISTQSPIDNITIVNVIGQVMLNNSFTDSKTTVHTCNISKLQAGVYFAAIRSNGKTITKKFIVVR